MNLLELIQQYPYATIGITLYLIGTIPQLINMGLYKLVKKLFCKKTLKVSQEKNQNSMSKVKSFRGKLSLPSSPENYKSKVNKEGYLEIGK